ncbi:YafY family protein [Spirosoma flavus]
MAKRDGAVSQLRLQRVIKLHKLFRSRRTYNLATLTHLCQEIDPGVTERTIAADIAFLRDELHAPLPEKANRWKGFKYEGMSYSIFEGLDDSFAGTLEELLAVVRQLASKPEFAGLEELLLRLEQRTAALDTNSDQALQFDEPELKGRQFLIPLYRAILSECDIQLTYEPFKQQPTTSIIHPVVLRQFNNRWFMLGWREDADSVQTFAIDRIVGLNLLSKPTDKRSFNAQTYFEHRIGVSKGEGPMEVVLRFSPDRAQYVLTKKLHRSQKTEVQKDGKLIVRLNVELNRELEAQILEFGPDVEVLIPEILREQIREHLTQALAHYK